MLPISTSSESSKRFLLLSTNATPTTIAVLTSATKPVGMISLRVMKFWLVVTVRLGICVALIVGAGFGVGLSVGFCVG